MRSDKPTKNLYPVKKLKARIQSLLCLIIVYVIVVNASGVSTGKIFNVPVVSAQTNENLNVQSSADDGNKISSEALRQIEALEKEKESRTPAQQKIDSNLLYQLKMERRQAITEEVPTLETDLKIDENGLIAVDITANVSNRVLKQLKAMNAEIIAVVPEYRSITAKIPLAEIESLAAMDEVIFIQPKLEARTNQKKIFTKDTPSTDNSMPFALPTQDFVNRNERAENVQEYLSKILSDEESRPAVGSATSEGDVTHRAVNARVGFKTSGAGIKIGVLSDGVNTLAARQSSGDLPPTVTVLTGQAGSGDEGTAMLEIVHDVAPDADLYFATAFTSITSFAQNIKALRAAGCDIIIDDVSYFAETPFQDGQAATVVSPSNAGVVVQAVNDVTVGSQAGAFYFSSAANSGNKNDGTSGAWEGDFADGGATASPLPTTSGYRVHSFGATNYTIETTTVSSTPVNLKWSDPLGGSTNDYDLYELNAGGTSVTRSSTNTQSGTQDPSEQLSGQTANRRIVIVKKTSAAARFLHLNMNGGTLGISTSGVVFGHNAGKNTISVAATPSGPAVYSVATGPYPNAYSSSNVVEIFSSDGPRRIFYNANGTAITTGNVSSTGGQLLQKPDITAADGVTTTTPGFIPFFGTSAAAPHAGALMALLKSAKPTATNTELYNAMTSTAIDIETPGVDRDSGYGIFMPDAALTSLGVQAYAYLQQGTVSATDAPGNGNGRVEPGESGTLSVQLKNIGLANATATSATLTTATAGVTILKPTKDYSDLAPNAAAASSTPWEFILANTFPCNGVINFTLTVNYAGGSDSSQTFNFSVSTIGYTNLFTENFDGVTAPALPAGWTTARTGTSPPALFATTATNPDTAPNAVFTNGVGTVASNSLISPSISLPTGQSSFQLSFRQTRDFENGSYDGGILELSTDGTTYNNVTSSTVGGSFASGGYNCTINSGYSNPIGGQNGWCNSQTTYETTTLNLPGTLSGQTIKLRWRAGWDSTGVGTNPNWRIDTIALAGPSACSSFTPSSVTINSVSPNPSSVGQNVTVSYSVTTVAQKNSAAPTATGTVTVTDGVDSCTGTVAAGQCTLAFNTPGNRTLRAFYMGDANNASSSSSAAFQQVLIAPTAASVLIGGRVLTPEGRGLVNAIVTVTDSDGNARSTLTSSFGYFHFDGISVGGIYILQINSKRYKFAPQVINVNEEVTDLNFVPQN